MNPGLSEIRMIESVEWNSIHQIIFELNSIDEGMIE